MNNGMIRPPALRPGDTVGITAPASCGDREGILRGASVLEQLGLRVRLGETLSLRHGYLAGEDEVRAAELLSLFADPQIRGIFCARGGYGSARIAPLLDYAVIRANPKVFWGYSDITFLHAAIGRWAGLVTFHGAMLVCLAGEQTHPVTLSSFGQLFGPQPLRCSRKDAPLTTIVAGQACGRLTGGNLTLLASTLGTPYELDTQGKLLLLEDIGEEPYRLDRMLNQLRQAGKLEEAAGFLIGDFRDCGPVKRKDSFTARQVIEHYIRAAGKPAVSGFPIGHSTPHLGVPLGTMVKLDATGGEAQWLEPGVSV
ncbi:MULTISPECIES: S66 peptidase family protein [Paenibacillus]|uniref:S66 peptidase family protein n=1 Tax=Paenibacillus TaxID=44249 RepID=UPI0022B93376|nr:LD-carboxypeptidase [Paenibacillus caseinilyticus]MCZ8521122.1 LD-carboxypeptidase [Paenibacillus caseinilyticus]